MKRMEKIEVGTTECGSKIWNNSKRSFRLISPIFEKSAINLNFHD